MNIFVDLYKDIIGTGDLVWEEDKFPYFENRMNMNGCKNKHKRIILREMLEGKTITAKAYAERPDGTTKFGTRLNEMEKETELPFTREWESNGKARWLKYGLDIKQLKEMK